MDRTSDRLPRPLCFGPDKLQKKSIVRLRSYKVQRPFCCKMGIRLTQKLRPPVIAKQQVCQRTKMNTSKIMKVMKEATTMMLKKTRPRHRLQQNGRNGVSTIGCGTDARKGREEGSIEINSTQKVSKLKYYRKNERKKEKENPCDSEGEDTTKSRLFGSCHGRYYC